MQCRMMGVEVPEPPFAPVEHDTLLVPPDLVLSVAPWQGQTK